MIEILGAGDQPRDFVGAEHDGQALPPFRIRQVLFHVPPLQHAQEEEAQGRNLGDDGADRQLALFKQEDLIAPEIIRADAIQSLAGVSAKGVDDLEIAVAGRGGVLAADEFVVQTL